MRPSPRLLIIVAAWCVLALGVSLLRIFTELELALITRGWFGLGVLLLLAIIIDRVSVNDSHKLNLKRIIPASQALGVVHKGEINIHNNLGRSIKLLVTDPPHIKLKIEKLPAALNIEDDEVKRVLYDITPVDRGDIELGQTRARIDSMWGLWQRVQALGDIDKIKVYPNYAPLMQIADLGLEHHVRQMGIHLSQRRGEGMDFKQLREFIEGDAVRQIDWRATARYRKPISREYQDERNQDIFFLLDCGRRMRHKEGDLNHFNHALNAILLLGYVAVNQGDAVGLGTFAGSDRWIKPVSGTVGVNKLLEQLYDLDTSLAHSDYIAAAQALKAKHRRRSLVILVTNLRTEATDDLVKATRLLSSHHLVIVASLREKFLDTTINEPVTDFNTALTFTATTEFTHQRNQTLSTLKSQGVIVLDTLPELLHIHLVDEYLRLKRSNRL
jgi:uncharacterized protein (DUF58 family)